MILEGCEHLTSTNQLQISHVFISVRTIRGSHHRQRWGRGIASVRAHAIQSLNRFPTTLMSKVILQPCIQMVIMPKLESIHVKALYSHHGGHSRSRFSGNYVDQINWRQASDSLQCRAIRWICSFTCFGTFQRYNNLGGENSVYQYALHISGDCCQSLLITYSNERLGSEKLEQYTLVACWLMSQGYHDRKNSLWQLLLRHLLVCLRRKRPMDSRFRSFTG
jgi:hypothetical protein